MTRCLNPVSYRHHHTWPGGFGRRSLAMFCLLGASLLGSCSGRPGNAPDPALPAPSTPEAAAAIAPADTATDTAVPLLATSTPPAERLLTASRQLQTRARRLVVPADPVAVDLYTLDSTCETYQVEPIQVPRFQSMENTVGLILAEQAIPYFTLSGYRASYDLETKTATIDLRVARTSRRVLQSLSLCEQKAMLGSLRETLIHQPDWNIDAVVFTDRGNDLVL
ncbi:hypothetical protein IQ254_29620 [Nodosilinea sp. LEGE 07088]|uniref:hypothetical protein n=1 Tax=Nodosilinea sp. LEGE 07088 TaxID=2777968 RepID=UPI001881F19C|nr:hypothetical protein [Nodosilinea sp. LEGE 07088]MBE9141302.1 hypothetical protein [Nodosilinea sp. LEGE 07088]